MTNRRVIERNVLERRLIRRILDRKNSLVEDQDGKTSQSVVREDTPAK